MLKVQNVDPEHYTLLLYVYEVAFFLGARQLLF